MTSSLVTGLSSHATCHDANFLKFKRKLYNKNVLYLWHFPHYFSFKLDHCFTELIEQDFLAIKYLHRYRRGHGFKSRTGLDFFLSGLISTSSSVAFIAVRIAYIRFLTPVHIYNFHISTIVNYHLDDLFGSNVMTRALYRYSRGHGFKSRTGLNFLFSGLISTTSALVFIAARIAYILFFTAVHIYN